MLTALLAKNSTFWMPERASTVAGDVDSLFGFIYWLCLFFFALVTVLLVVFVLRYRHRPGQARDPGAGHSTALELTWTIIPSILVLAVFYQGFRAYLNMAVEPPNPYEIQVLAETWNWTFFYPNGGKSNELHLPINVPVRFVLSSKDVIHSLYIPQFRVKKDAVPGRYNRFWVQATEVSPPEGFDVYCAEYCGTNHSTMRAKVVVHPDIESFEAWAKEAGNWEGRMSYLQAGETFIKSSGCLQCHAIDSEKGPSAPGFKNLYGSQVPILGAGTVLADENYIRESIYEPQAKIHQGYPKPSPMPSFRAQLSDRDVNAIIVYMKSISVHFKGDLSQYKVIARPATGPATAPTTRESPQPGTGPATAPARGAGTQENR